MVPWRTMACGIDKRARPAAQDFVLLAVDVCAGANGGCPACICWLTTQIPLRVGHAQPLDLEGSRRQTRSKSPCTFNACRDRPVAKVDQNSSDSPQRRSILAHRSIDWSAFSMRPCKGTAAARVHDVAVAPCQMAYGRRLGKPGIRSCLLSPAVLPEVVAPGHARPDLNAHVELRSPSVGSNQAQSSSAKLDRGETVMSAGRMSRP